MKKGLSVFLLWFVLISLTAQNYYPLVTTGKVWSTAHSYGQPFPWFSYYLKFEGDSLIDGLLYKQVWKSQDTTQLGWISNGFIREENKKVYYLSWAGGPPNNLLYDFGVSPGDTVYLFSDPMGIWFNVDSIGNYTLLTGEIRKKISLSCYLTGTFLGNDTWIEGMGSLFGVLESGACALIGDNPKLLCFHENDTLKYMNPGYNTCHLPTGFQTQNAKQQGVKVFINNENKIIVRTDKEELLPLEIQFLDITGKQLFRMTISKKVTEIEQDQFPATFLLMFQIFGNQGFHCTGKVQQTLPAQLPTSWGI